MANRSGRGRNRKQASRPGARGAPEPASSPHRLPGFLRSPATAVVAAAGALLTALVVGVGLELFPVQEIADRLQLGDSIGVTVVSLEPQAGVPGAAARERLASDASARAVEAMRAPLPRTVGGTPLVAIGWTTVYLDLRGRRSRPVDILDMRIRVLARAAPLAGTLLLGPGPQGGDANLVLQATVDAPAPKLTQENDTRSYFAGHHISLAHGEVVPVSLAIHATRCYCEWDLAIDYVAGGQRAAAYVNSQGLLHGSHDDRPFAITGQTKRIEDYGVVYGVDQQADVFRYRRLSADRYCPAVRGFYSDALDGWAC